jgi:hypothetical protein
VPTLAGTPSPAPSIQATLPPPPSQGPATTAHLTIVASSTSVVDSVRAEGPCGGAGSGYAAQLVFQLAGQPYVLSMNVLDYHGPGSYPVPPERVSLHTQAGAPQPKLAAAVSGSVVVNADERSGSIDTSLSDSSRVFGTWTCGT